MHLRNTRTISHNRRGCIFFVSSVGVCPFFFCDDQSVPILFSIGAPQTPMTELTTLFQTRCIECRLAIFHSAARRPQNRSIWLFLLMLQHVLLKMHAPLRVV